MRISPISVKLYATGNSKAEKNDMIEQFKKESNYKIEKWEKIQDGIADAWFIYQIGKDILGCRKNMSYINNLNLDKKYVLYGLLGMDLEKKRIEKIRNKEKKNKVKGCKNVK
jgi:hypothetical protein